MLLVHRISLNRFQAELEICLRLVKLALTDRVTRDETATLAKTECCGTGFQINAQDGNAPLLAANLRRDNDRFSLSSVHWHGIPPPPEYSLFLLLGLLDILLEVELFEQLFVAVADSDLSHPSDIGHFALRTLFAVDQRGDIERCCGNACRPAA